MITAFFSISPEAYFVCLGIVLLLFEAFFTRPGSKRSVGLAAAVGLALGLVLTFRSEVDAARYVLPAGLVHFYMVFAITATFFVTLMALDYRKVLARFTDFPESENGTGEFYCLPVFACAGMLWMIQARDLISAFVALELVTITFYILVAYMRRNVGSLEAGVKYLILGALSAGFTVYGIAWIFGATGTTSFVDLPQAMAAAAEAGRTSMLLFGIALVLVGLGFKVGAVPMQIWIPDVYQGAPTPTAAFLSVASKAAGFALLLTFLTPILLTGAVRAQALLLLAILAGATLFFGNLAALAQSNLKRLLAYSSIAHAGFLLMPLAGWEPGVEVSGRLSGAEVVSFYLATYLIMTLSAFFALGAVSSAEGSEEIEAFDGLAKRNPALALALAITMAALAGLPLTVGFYGKFFVFQAAVAAGLWPLVGIGFLAVAAGFYYYFKLIKAMYWNLPGKSEPIVLPGLSRVCITVLTAATLFFGIYPAPLLAVLGIS